MYLGHFGLNEPPFRITPDTGFFFAGANRGATLEALQYAVLNEEGIVKVTGEVGSGKTMLCRVLIERLPKAVEIIYLANPSLAREEILLAIADELGLVPEAPGPSGTRLLKALHEKLIALYAQGRRVVVLVDEAHAMPKETLEEIRLLSNLESRHNKLLHLVLFGQPELEAHLDSPDMRPLKERITHSFRLEPLVRTDVEGYIEFRLRAAGYRGPNPFSPGAVRLIADASIGLTRRINILCDKSLLAAFAANSHAVTEREARRAIADTEFTRTRGRGNRLMLAAAGAAAGLAAGVAIAWAWLYQGALLPASGPPATMAAAAPGPDASATGRDTRPVSPPGPSTATEARRSDAVASSFAAKEKPAADAAGSPAVARVSGSALKGAETAPARPGQAAVGPVTPTGSAAESATRGVGSAADRPDVARTTESAAATRPPPADDARRTDPFAEPPSKGSFVRERFLATQAWLKQAPPENYSLQLVAARHTELAQLEDFLRRAAALVPEDDLYVYSVRINGQQYYRASYGNYLNLSEVRQAMKSLPGLFLAQQPFPRSFDRMRQHNSQ